MPNAGRILIRARTHRFISVAPGAARVCFLAKRSTLTYPLGMDAEGLFVSHVTKQAAVQTREGPSIAASTQVRPRAKFIHTIIERKRHKRAKSSSRGVNFLLLSLSRISFCHARCAHMRPRENGIPRGLARDKRLERSPIVWSQVCAPWQMGGRQKKFSLTKQMASPRVIVYLRNEHPLAKLRNSQWYLMDDEIFVHTAADRQEIERWKCLHSRRRAEGGD